MEDQKFTIEAAIDEGITRLEGMDPATEEYTTAVENLKKVTDVKKAIEKPKRGPSPDAILGALVTVGMGALLFIGEKSGLYLGSKPISWLHKPKF